VQLFLLIPPTEPLRRALWQPARPARFRPQTAYCAATSRAVGLALRRSNAQRAT
jgi:hypothetical protein